MDAALDAPTPTCTDGAKNGDETDVDCGGRCGAAPMACIAPMGTTARAAYTVCQVPRCGDHVQQGDEACDDGNDINGDGCDDGAGEVCLPTGCGNGTVTGIEACDDAAPAENGDGCSATCGVEAGYLCSGSPSICMTICGDGIRVGGEECDDGNRVDDDACSNTCLNRT